MIPFEVVDDAEIARNPRVRAIPPETVTVLKCPSRPRQILCLPELGHLCVHVNVLRQPALRSWCPISKIPVEILVHEMAIEGPADNIK
jgi:hypothetical protein